jgi:hypothetical protein
MHCVYFPTNDIAMNMASKHPRLAQAAAPSKLASYLPLRTVRVREAVSVVQAIGRAPNLASLAKMAALSAECMRLVTPLIPAPMRSGVQSGPLTRVRPEPESVDATRGEHTQWCLLAANSAVAAKLRQLAPALAAHLRTHGHDVQDIRIKITMRPSR